MESGNATTTLFITSTSALPILPILPTIYPTPQIPPKSPLAPYLHTSPYPQNFVFTLFGAIILLFFLIAFTWRLCIRWTINRSIKAANERVISASKMRANTDAPRPSSHYSQVIPPVVIQSTYGGLGPAYEHSIDLGDKEEIFEMQDKFLSRPSHGQRTPSAGTGTTATTNSDRRSIRSGNWSIMSDLGVRTAAAADRLSIIGGDSNRRSYVERKEPELSDAFRQSSYNASLYHSPTGDLLRGQGMRPGVRWGETVRRSSGGYPPSMR